MHYAVENGLEEVGWGEIEKDRGKVFRGGEGLWKTTWRGEG